MQKILAKFLVQPTPTPPFQGGAISISKKIERTL